jgi:large subunit ribosomal protein L22
MITASLQNYRITPRKFRVVADMIRGKSVAQAEVILMNAAKKAKNPLSDLLASAVANASHNHKIEAGDLFVKEIRVDQGYILRRSQPMSRGSAFPIKKRTSHVLLVLSERGDKAKSKKEEGKKATGKAGVVKKSSKTEK